MKRGTGQSVADDGAVAVAVVAAAAAAAGEAEGGQESGPQSLGSWQPGHELTEQPTGRPEAPELQLRESRGLYRPEVRPCRS